MIRLTDESGARGSGKDWDLRAFPVLLGRAEGAEVRVEGNGVWDQHARLELNLQEGFQIHALGEALLIVNGESVRQARLRNGDTMALGAVRLGFRFSETEQQGFAWRESVTWGALACLCLGQLLLVYLALP